ncbi:TIGR02679 family protein [Frankia sp. AgPm24]|uniref:TIGR02679 family protein n=1 Tax=Frankia sp. AgPm24 TaxID=631128 RepID=UPI0020102B10|nr:TIGR02679 family protein [Frankia sp. AgPm24]MCK9921269.1 TIGR02679 family protein [Frankia sp. AgPm24]
MSTEPVIHHGATGFDLTEVGTAVSGTVDLERLGRLFGPPTQWILARARSRLERGGSLTGALTLPDPSEQQRVALAGLLGRRPRSGRSLRVDVDDLDTVVRRSGCAPSLAAAVVALTGPVVDRAALAAEAARDWQAVFALADPLVDARPALGAWRDRLGTTGLLRRLAGSREEGQALMAAAVSVLGALPADGAPISVFAARVLGDGHGLDTDRPLSSLLLDAVALLGRSLSADADDGDAGDDGPDELVGRTARSAEWRREAWAAVGVLVSELALPVLTLGLPGNRHSVTGRVLDLWRGAGEPVHLSLRQLVGDPPTLTALAGTAVFVCENPAVVSAAADRLGARCRPLVCVGGMPAAAAASLLRLLADAGAVLRYHGDFDWGGLAIANTVTTRFGAVPWRYDRAHYERALRPGLARLTGRPVDARFDPDLSDALGEHRHRVEEEAVLDDLLADLGPTPPADPGDAPSVASRDPH